MPAIVFNVKSAKKHPYANSLRLYSMGCTNKPDIQIIANLENIYEVGDNVIVAMVDSILNDHDGTIIEAVRIRGLYSHGMALGKTDEPVGTDLSANHCNGFVKRGAMIKWTSIESFHNVVRNLKNIKDLGEHFSWPKVTYKSKIKLHGTNAAVQITSDGKVIAQSRTSVITKDNDNCGFARWVDDNIDYFKKLAANERNLTIFGEWAGPGIQKGTAIHKIDHKIFAIFAIIIRESNGEQVIQADPVVINDWLWYRRDEEKFNVSITDHPDIFVIPWYEDREFVINYGDKKSLKPIVDEINALVLKIEAQDPWVKSVFDVDGIGEGLVFYPVKKDDEFVSACEDYSDLFFKAKGEKHKVVKQKDAVQIDPEVAKNINEFVELFITPARLDQAVTIACNEEFNIRFSGAFLKWICSDIKKESVAELEASNLNWKQVSKAVSSAAITWYKNKTEELC